MQAPNHPAETSAPFNQYRLIGAFLFILLAAGCATTPTSTNDPRFAQRHKDYHYTQANVTIQKDRLGCGLACLVTVMANWNVHATEDQLAQQYPVSHEDGYTLEDLKTIATDHGLQAFVLQWDENPRSRLEEQVRLGRPVICAVKIPWSLYVYKGWGPADGAYRAWSWRFGSRINHFVAVCGYTENRVLVMDPRVGFVTLTWPRFLEAWAELHHAALLVAS